MVRVLPLLLLLAAPLHAQEVVSDAFGILPAEALTGDRATWAGHRTGAETAAPGAAAAILLFVGRKSLTAGGDEGQAAALVLDGSGNLVADGTSVDFALGGSRRTGVALRGGIGSADVVPGPEAGTFAAGAAVEGAQSARVLYSVTSDLASVTPDLAPLTGAEVETDAVLATAPLSDRFGNPVEDGTALPVTIRHADGSLSLATAVARGGSATARIIVRGIETDGVARTSLGGAASQAPFGVTRPAAIGPTEARLWPVAELGALGLRIGPVTTDRGYLVTDGAPVRIRLTAPGGEAANAEGWLRDGHFEAILPLPATDGLYLAEIETPLGAERMALRPSNAPGPARGTE